MQGHQANSGECQSRGHRPGNRVGNVVEFQIEEYPKPKTRKPFYGLRAFGGEELAADLQQSRRTAQLPRQGTRRPQAIYIQGDN